MKTDLHHDQNVSLMAAREAIGCRCLYDRALTRSDCERIYGKPVSRQLWSTWLRKVMASADADGLTGFTEATHYLLLVNARLLRGNGRQGRTKVSRRRLAAAVFAALEGMPSVAIPDISDRQTMTDLITAQALTTYSDRHYRRAGIYKGRTYTRSEVQEILSKFPNHHDQAKQAI